MNREIEIPEVFLDAACSGGMLRLGSKRPNAVRQYGTVPMDLRAFLLEPLNGQIFDACLTAAESGILAGTAIALNRASGLGLSVLSHLPDGSDLKPGTCVLSIQGTANRSRAQKKNFSGASASRPEWLRRIPLCRPGAGKGADRLWRLEESGP